MRQRVACNQHDLLATVLNGLPDCLSKCHRLLIHDLVGVVVCRAVAANRDDGFVPFRVQHVTTDDGAVVDAEVGVSHHLGYDARL